MRTDVQKVVERFDKRWNKAGGCIEKYTKGILVYLRRRGKNTGASRIWDNRATAYSRVYYSCN